MTEQEILEIAFEIGLLEYYELESDSDGISMLLDFAKLIAYKERKECARILSKNDLSVIKDKQSKNLIADMLISSIDAMKERTINA